MIYIQDLTKKELMELLRPLSRLKSSDYRNLNVEEQEKKLGKQAQYRAQQIYHWVYQRFVMDWDEMTDLSKELRSWLKQNIRIARLRELQRQQSTDGTAKLLWELEDGKTIESVLIPAEVNAGESQNTIEDEEGDDSAEPAGRLTLCISSQVGCAMQCKFCLTGVRGIERNLKTYEIVGQVWELKRQAGITNIVFMGMGEPLNNLDHVSKACEILLDQDGMNFSKRKVTVSTCGVVPNIVELGKRVDVSLAISLNATTDELRSELMPINRKWNLQALLEACRNYPLGSHRRITFEYVLLKDVNDSLEDAGRLIGLLEGIPSKINLIPFNEHPGSDLKRPSDETVHAFQKYLLDRGFTAPIRSSKGRDILAACGQLRGAHQNH